MYLDSIHTFTPWKSSRIYINIFFLYIYIRGSLNKFQNFFRMSTFIDSTHMKL